LLGAAWGGLGAEDGSGTEPFFDFEDLGGGLPAQITAAEEFPHGFELGEGPEWGATAFSFLVFECLEVGIILAFDGAIPLLAGDEGSRGAVIVTAQTRQLAKDLTQALPAFFGVGFLADERGSDAGEFHGRQAGVAVADALAVGGIIQFFMAVGEDGDEGTAFLEAQPFEITALPPFGEVLLGDGTALELLFEDRPNVGEAIEPFDQISAWLGVSEAERQFVADGLRQACDFSNTGSAHISSVQRKGRRDGGRWAVPESAVMGAGNLAAPRGSVWSVFSWRSTDAIQGVWHGLAGGRSVRLTPLLPLPFFRSRGPLAEEPSRPTLLLPSTLSPLKWQPKQSARQPTPLR